MVGESYPVVLCAAGWRGLGARLKKMAPSGRVLVVTQARVRRLYGAGLAAALRAAGLRVDWCEVPDGERAKSLKELQRLYRRFAALGADRHTPVLSLGGGVVGDVGGYAAATFMRGLPWVVLPTTLVAQLDSAVGGKVGVNLPAGKNLVGTFYQPCLVFANLDVLRTLPKARLCEGGIEALKCGWIGAPALARRLHRLPTSAAEYLTIIHAALRVKIRLIQEDVQDRRGRRIFLNLGHTVGHALERHGAYRRWTHGQAVALGLKAAAYLSVRWGYCRDATAQQLTVAVDRIAAGDLPRLSATTWARLLAGEKKRRGDVIECVALRDLGRPLIHPIAVGELATELAGC